MKQITKADIKKAISNRWWAGLVVVNALLTVVGIILIIASIEPRETQVITHYSSFSVMTFYRGYWYHLYGYVALVLIMGVGHVLLSLKLLHMERRDLALALLWANLVLIVVAVLFALSNIRIAALG